MVKLISLKINNDGDLVLEDGDLVLVDEKEEWRQAIFSILSINKNEWFLDTELGLDYSKIIDKTNENRIKIAITEAIMQEPRTRDVYIDKVEIDRNRHLKVHGFATDIEGYSLDLLEMEVL